MKIKSKIKSALNKTKTSRPYRLIKEIIGWDDVIALILGFIGVAYYIFGTNIGNEDFQTFYERIHIELIGISITILMLGNAEKINLVNAEKHRLILQMGSPDNGFAREAVRQIKQRGWLYDGTIRNAHLVEANLIKANMDYANLENAWLILAKLNGARLISANLKNAQLASAKLNEAMIFDANLEQADLRDTHFEKAMLFDSNLSQANLHNAHLQGALYNKNTIWPIDFDPKLSGATLVGIEEIRKIIGSIEGVFG